MKKKGSRGFKKINIGSKPARKEKSRITRHKNGSEVNVVNFKVVEIHVDFFRGNNVQNAKLFLVKRQCWTRNRGVCGLLTLFCWLLIFHRTASFLTAGGSGL